MLQKFGNSTVQMVGFGIKIFLFMFENSRFWYFIFRASFDRLLHIDVKQFVADFSLHGFLYSEARSRRGGGVEIKDLLIDRTFFYFLLETRF